MVRSTLTDQHARQLCRMARATVEYVGIQFHSLSLARSREAATSRIKELEREIRRVMQLQNTVLTCRLCKGNRQLSVGRGARERARVCPRCFGEGHYPRGFHF